MRFWKTFPDTCVFAYSASGKKDLSDYIEKYNELENRIEKAHRQAVGRQSEVQRKIERMRCEDEIERKILTYRYVMGDTWEKICDNLGYSNTNVHRIHRKAMGHFDPVCG